MFCHSIRLFCVWASRRQESPRSSLVRHRAAWNHQRTPFQQRLGAQMGTVFAACVADFFSNMARKVMDFQGLLLGAFFVPVFGPGLLTCADRVPIFGPKIRTPSRGQKHNSDCNYLCPLLWRPVALDLERFHECLLSGASAETRQDQVTHSRRMKSSSKQICAQEADTVVHAQMDVTHIPGYDIELNWRTSRMDISQPLPLGLQASDRIRIDLRQIWFPTHEITVFPKGSTWPIP